MFITKHQDMQQKECALLSKYVALYYTFIYPLYIAVGSLIQRAFLICHYIVVQCHTGSI